ncbi:MAG TPA: cell division protein ZapA [Bacteroidales bacterium]|nr:cell division protein ZapA [Bacteroidales bacterium]HRZ21576.1 cell division protein ZapA [Bacteroidales bacterium]
MEELSITLSLANRSYHMKIHPRDEEIVRKAAKEINELMKEYADIYAFNDQQDLLAMVALHFTTAAIHAEYKLLASETMISQRLSELDEALTSTI